MKSLEQNASGSVTKWIRELESESAEQSLAQQRLWERYFARLAALARSRMPPDARLAGDEEDVALSALSSFFRRANNSEFPHLHDRSGLWPLLARITVFKAIKQVQHERAEKRGGHTASDNGADDADRFPSLDEIISEEPTPDFVVQMQEQVESLLASLADPLLREIATLKLAGHRNTTIAETKGMGLRSVERKLARIRTLWAHQRISE